MKEPSETLKQMLIADASDGDHEAMLQLADYYPELGYILKCTAWVMEKSEDAHILWGTQ